MVGEFKPKPKHSGMRKFTSVITLSFFFAALFSSAACAAVVAPKYNVADSSALPDSASVKAAIADFKNLSRRERKERINEVKHSLKEYKRAKRSGGDGSTDTVLLAILAILLPPLAVYLHEGEINKKFWIDLILTLLFFLPGIIYALIVVFDAD